MSKKYAAKLPLWVTILHTISLIGTAILSGIFIHEMTFLSWEFGPQNVGFSLVHGSGAGLLIFPFLLILSSGIIVFYVIKNVIKRKRVSINAVIAICLAIMLWIIGSLPYSFWQRQFAEEIANSPHAIEFINHAACWDDLKTIKVLISNGVAINVPNPYDGKTALHISASTGNMEIVEYLVSMGANPNLCDSLGETPIEKAMNHDHTEVIEYLLAHGSIMPTEDATRSDSLGITKLKEKDTP
ncbi:MAG: ankyrin repeat domain-containing protein [Candidatus Zixiibacteriota bacterium]